MKPWAIDASQAGVAPIGNDDIQRFLDGTDTTRTVLVAPKGFGKSLLLRERARRSRLSPLRVKKNTPKQRPLAKRYDHIHPSGSAEIVERLRITYARAQYEWAEYPETNTIGFWTSIFQYSIVFLVVWNEAFYKKSVSAISLANQINDVLKISSVKLPYNKTRDKNTGGNIEITLSTIISSLLPNWFINQEYDGLYVRCSAFVSELQNSHAYFFDAADEAFKYSGSESGSLEVKSEFELTYKKYWVCLCVGLVEAVRTIKLLSSRITIYTSLRAEAANAQLSEANELEAQQEEIVLRLQYSKHDLEEIFNSNIRLMQSMPSERAYLHSPDYSFDLIVAFLGSNKSLQLGTGKEELLLDAIIRHTRMRPRDLMIIGGALREVPVLSRVGIENNHEALRVAINSAGTKIFGYAKTECVPAWPSGVDQFIRKFRTNIVPDFILNWSDLSSTENEGSRNGNLEIRCCQFLYAQGLIAPIVEMTGGSQRSIQFLPSHEVTSSLVPVPNSRFYAIHPILYGFLINSHGRADATGYHSAWDIIVGQKYVVKDISIIHLHVANDVERDSYIVVRGIGVIRQKIDRPAFKMFAILMAFAQFSQTLKFELWSVACACLGGKLGDTMRNWFASLTAQREGKSIPHHWGLFFGENRALINTINEFIRSTMFVISGREGAYVLRYESLTTSGEVLDTSAASQHQCIANDACPIKYIPWLSEHYKLPVRFLIRFDGLSLGELSFNNAE